MVLGLRLARQAKGGKFAAKGATMQTVEQLEAAETSAYEKERG